MDFSEKFITEETVTEDKLACNVGSGSLRVYATPMVAALMEKAATLLAQKHLSDEFTTVGIMLNIEHTSPTPIGGQVRAEATLKNIEGRTFNFDVAAFDNCGEIARGTHKRISVMTKRFQEKADCKLEK